jgi:GNAT superfamily N-acetyltransferase
MSPGRERPYPDEPAERFERPPISFTDADGRPVELYAYEGRREGTDSRDRSPPSGPSPESDGAFAPEDAFAALVAMYVDFDPADRAQGIPPPGEERIREWLDRVLGGGQDVIAVVDGRAVGHATLVPDGKGAAELAIFVLHTHQGAGIGSRLIAALLGQGQREGVERVWLTVERWNGVAIALYHKVGFETCGTDSFEIEMSIRLS